MREPWQVAAATVLGAVAGGVAGYLFFTERGRRLRQQIEPGLDELTRELGRLRATLHKAARAAEEGGRLIDDLAPAGGEAGWSGAPPQRAPF
ncbi:MAG: YtxH domain-containing protein [Acidobacteriota bacterium]|nr:YtxH domain-containing protein [Acidobacteriota bacterium]